MTDNDVRATLRATIRDVPDFPKPGIVFKDITPVLADAALFKRTTSAMADGFVHERITHVVAIESRGFIFGAPVAQILNASFVPMRKPGKLPYKIFREEYDLEYGKDVLEMHQDALPAGARALVVDDVLATGGTARAACRLAERFGATVVGCSFLIELGFLGGRAKLDGRGVHAVIRFD